jgi:hypothetical protein
MGNREEKETRKDMTAHRKQGILIERGKRKKVKKNIRNRTKFKRNKTMATRKKRTILFNNTYTHTVTT